MQYHKRTRMSGFLPTNHQLQDRPHLLHPKSRKNEGFRSLIENEDDEEDCNYSWCESRGCSPATRERQGDRRRVDRCRCRTGHRSPFDRDIQSGINEFVFYWGKKAAANSVTPDCLRGHVASTFCGTRTKICTRQIFASRDTIDLIGLNNSDRKRTRTRIRFCHGFGSDSH